MWRSSASLWGLPVYVVSTSAQYWHITDTGGCSQEFQQKPQPKVPPRIYPTRLVAALGARDLGNTWGDRSRKDFPGEVRPHYCMKMWGKLRQGWGSGSVATHVVGVVKRLTSETAHQRRVDQSSPGDFTQSFLITTMSDACQSESQWLSRSAWACQNEATRHGIEERGS